jgi:hypothetical protein
MGNAFTAIADDAYATYWNPAGLAQITRSELALNHLQYIEKINSEFAAFVLPINKLAGSVGVSGTYINMGTIDRRDATGATTGGDTAVTAYSGSLGWGQAFGERIALGAGARVLSQNLAGEKSSGVAGDVGLLFALVPNRVNLGFAAVNVGPKLNTGTVKEDLPRTLRGGIAYHLLPGQLTLAVDGEKERDTSFTLHAGGEYIYQGRFVVRAGFQDNKDSKGGLSAGAGFIWHPQRGGSTDFFGNQDKTPASGKDSLEVRFDYGFIDYGDLDATHRLGIHVAF